MLIGDGADDATLGETLLFRADKPNVLDSDMLALLSAKAFDYADLEGLADEASALPPMASAVAFDAQWLETVARDVREWIGCDDSPLPDPVAALEVKGLKVIFYPMPDAISGFSAYTQRVGGVIFVNRSHPTERRCFTVMHELAHLVLHREEYRQCAAIVTKQSDKERSASYLAGAILLPRDTILTELRAWRGRWIPEPILQDVKLRYCVSMRTVIKRAEQVGLISKMQCDQQIDRLDRDYGRTSEPGHLQESQAMPRFTRLVYTALLGDAITASRAAELLGLPLREVNNALAGWLGGTGV
jgi:Zn-dependent peptidase ImmA (M78 family)